ncbi:MAG: hypothetical protein SOZ27_06170 [Spirochaetia bacterium]|nr:hypothetical protein [Spirochaetia bacterium]
MREFFNEKTQKRIDSLLSEINQTNDEFSQLKKALAVGLYRTAEPLHIANLTPELWSQYFPDGTVQSPIESVKMGKNQFAKLDQPDRNHLLDGLHETLLRPSMILNTTSFDKTENKWKPIHIYAKSFYHESSDNDKVIQSVIIFRDSSNVSVSTHSKDLERIFKFFKDPQELIYMDKGLEQKTSLALQQSGCSVDLKHINTRPINLAYDEKNLLIEHSFGEKTKTAGINPDRMTPLDHTKGGSRAGLMEQRSKDLPIFYKNPDILSSEKSDSGKNPLDRFLEEKGLKNTQQEIKESKNKGFEL